MLMKEQSVAAKIAQFFKNGRRRAIRIPKEFEIYADQVEITMTEDGDLLVHPVKKMSLLEVLATMEPLAEEDWMPEIDDSDLLPLDDVEI